MYMYILFIVVYMIIYNDIYIYICICISIHVYIYIHIFASIFTKWKIFYQCLLIPESGKAELISFIPLYFCFYCLGLKTISPIHFTSKIRMNVNDLEYFQIKKNQIEKLESTFISTNWKKM